LQNLKAEECDDDTAIREQARRQNFTIPPQLQKKNGALKAPFFDTYWFAVCGYLTGLRTASST
jgi:hypothetical protein